VSFHVTDAFSIRYPNLLKDIAFVEYADEESATVAKEALHNFKIDGETKMKVSGSLISDRVLRTLKHCSSLLGVVCEEVGVCHMLYNFKWSEIAYLVLKQSGKAETNSHINFHG
jgi:hypothetical protein